MNGSHMWSIWAAKTGTPMQSSHRRSSAIYRPTVIARAPYFDSSVKPPESIAYGPRARGRRFSFSRRRREMKRGTSAFRSHDGACVPRKKVSMRGSLHRQTGVRPFPSHPVAPQVK